MQENIHDIYRQRILPLADSEQLKLASLILEQVTKREGSGNNNGTKRSIRDLFGKGHSGNVSGADNDTIDADLARAYLDTHEDAK